MNFSLILAVIATGFLWIGAAGQAEEALASASKQGTPTAGKSLEMLGQGPYTFWLLFFDKDKYNKVVNSKLKQAQLWFVIFLGAFLGFVAALAQISGVLALLVALALIVYWVISLVFHRGDGLRQRGSSATPKA